MKYYVIIKDSRRGGIINRTRAYMGPTCDNAGVPKGKVYTDKKEAEEDAKKLSYHNMVGFHVEEFEEAP